jgi:GTP-binding protein
MLSLEESLTSVAAISFRIFESRVPCCWRMAGVIAIVGRPNVGKSALFNRIVGRRIAIVHDEPGVTRDRISAEAEWHGRRFTLIDTGGIGLVQGERAQDVITRAALDQVNIAIESATVIILVVNAQEGVVPLDQEVANLLRRSGKPVLVAANKVDHDRAGFAVADFSRFGFEKIHPVSAIHGLGIDDLLEDATEFLPPAEKEAALDPRHRPKLAIVGRPNVGKSSLVNALTKSDRVVVSAIPGTTRDSVDVPLEIEGEGGRESYLLIDTAGLRQSRHVSDSVEFFSTKRAEDSIARCDIAIFVIDAESGIAEQDKKIGGMILDSNKPCILAVNKWDLFQETVRKAQEGKHKQKGSGKKRMTTLPEFGQWIHQQLFFLDYAPVIFISAKEGYSLDRLLEAVRYVASQLRQKIPTAVLNRTLHEAIEARQPVSARGDRLKFFYATQVHEAPPKFLLFVNREHLLSKAYRKYLSTELRKAFGFEGCPVILLARSRVQKDRKPPIRARSGHKRIPY